VSDREIMIGVRADLEKGVQFYGTEEVNRFIADGWIVEAVMQGNAMFRQFCASEGRVNLVFTGCEFRVLMRAPVGEAGRGK
jgi:hypothetical protein